MRKTGRKVGIIVLLIATILLIGGCGKSSSEKQMKEQIDNMRETMAQQQEDAAYAKKHEEELESQLKEASDFSEDLKNKLSEESAKRQEAEASVAELTEQIEQLKAKGKGDSLSSKDENVIDIMFWKDGKTYLLGNEEIFFYSEEYCKEENKLGEIPKIVSPIVKDFKLPNGHSGYMVRSENGMIFSTQEPYLQEETTVVAEENE